MRAGGTRRHGAASGIGAAFRDNWKTDLSSPFPPGSPALVRWRIVSAGTRAQRVEQLGGGLCRVEEGNSELGKVRGDEEVVKDHGPRLIFSGEKAEASAKGTLFIRARGTFAEIPKP